MSIFFFGKFLKAIFSNILIPEVISMGSSIPKYLLRTLKTFPSNTAFFSLKANDAIADAVYLPIPFSWIKSS